MIETETVWDVMADEARYERDRAEAEEPWLLDGDDEPSWEDLREPPFPDPEEE